MSEARAVPPGKVRVKKLSDTFDTTGDQQVLETAPILDDRENPGDFMAPTPVFAREMELDLAQVERKLRIHALTRDDLIDDGSGWMSIGDYPPLAEVMAAIRPSVHERLKRVGLDKGAGWVKLVLVLLCLALLGAMGWKMLGEVMRGGTPTSVNGADWGIPPVAGAPARPLEAPDAP